MEKSLTTRPMLLAAVAFLVVSLLGVVVSYQVLSSEGPAFATAVWLFYAPAWLLSNAFFGGIHGAPAWSVLPSVVLAVVGQNLLICLAVRWVVKRLAQRRIYRSLSATESDK